MSISVCESHWISYFNPSVILNSAVKAIRIQVQAILFISKESDIRTFQKRTTTRCKRNRYHIVEN